MLLFISTEKKISFSPLFESTLIALFAEVVVRRCSVKKMFLETSQNSQENTCAGVSFLIKLQAWLDRVDTRTWLV